MGNPSNHVLVASATCPTTPYGRRELICWLTVRAMAAPCAIWAGAVGAALPLLTPLAPSATFLCGARPLRLVAPLSPAHLRHPLLPVRAASSEETPTESSDQQLDELFSDLKSKWDSIENKSTLFAYGGGAVFAFWLSATIVSAINSVPLLPKIMELIGLGYTGWFVYRYLLYKESREELAADIEELKSKIAGTQKDE